MNINRYINIVFFTSLLLFSACENSSYTSESTDNDDSNDDTPTERTIPEAYVPEVSQDYDAWVKKGSPVQEVVPMPYLPPRIETTSASISRTYRANSFPSSFDLRDPNSDTNQSDSFISSVKNQGSCGSCWAFAGIAAIEGSYAESTNYDFSEDNLKHKAGFTLGNDVCDGGLSFSIATYLSLYNGLISETQDPYDPSINSDYCNDCTPVKYVDNSSFYFGRDTNNELRVELIKTLLIEKFKPVQVNLEVPSGTAGESGTSIFDSETKSYYQAHEANINHAVVIVGYDNNKIVQGQQGVFIVKNSWGTDSYHTDNGYNYVPYSDKSIGVGLIITYDDLPEDSYNFDRLYAHDDFGMLGTGYDIESSVAYGANIYKSFEDDEAVVGINIFNLVEGSTFEFEIHSVSSSSLPTWGDTTTLLGQRVDKPTDTTMGYHTVVLDAAITLPKQSRFAVLIKYIAPPLNNIIIPRESYHPLAANHTANAGESYTSETGENGSWYDIGENDNTNLIVKVMTKDTTPELLLSSPTLTIESNTTTAEINATVAFTAVGVDSDGEILSYEWDFGDDILSSVQNPNHSYIKSGTYMVSCSVTDDDNLTAQKSIEITINPQIILQMVWQDNNESNATLKQWLTEENYQTCYDNTQPNGTGGDHESCHDTTGDTAISYCLELTLNGITEWRLPTSQELIDNVDINFTYFSQAFYWSSTELDDVASSAYKVKYKEDNASYNGKNASYNVRCIYDRNVTVEE